MVQAAPPGCLGRLGGPQGRRTSVIQEYWMGRIAEGSVPGSAAGRSTPNAKPPHHDAVSARTAAASAAHTVPGGAGQQTTPARGHALHTTVRKGGPRLCRGNRRGPLQEERNEAGGTARTCAASNFKELAATVGGGRNVGRTEQNPTTPLTPPGAFAG